MAIIGALPATLLNGTTADASQVMSDLNFIVSQVNANALPATGGVTLTGTLAVTGSISATAGLSTTATNGVYISAASGQNAMSLSKSAGHDQWGVGSDSAGNFEIFDFTGGVTALTITPAREWTLYQDVTVAGNATVDGSITGTTITASGSLNVAATPNGVCYFTANGVRAWYIGALNDGQFYFTDQSAGIATATIGNGNGQWTWNYPGVFSNNLTCNGQMQSASLYVTGASTQVGTISCNAINCATLNTQGNAITCGSITVNGPFAGNAISCSTINTNGNVLTTGIVDCTNGSSISFPQQGTGHRFAFTSTGAQLTFYVNGSAMGSFTFNAPSDERIKKNIGAAQGDALAELCRVKLISFDYREPRDEKFQPTHLRYGFSGQQLLSVIPEAVNKSESAEVDDGLMLNVDVMPLIARLVGAVQQLAERVMALEAK